MQTELKSMMGELKITQGEMAKALQINERTMSNKMRGKQDFTYTEVCKICKMTGILNPIGVINPIDKKEDTTC